MLRCLIYDQMTRPVPRTSGKQVNGVKVSTPPTQTGNKASNGHVLSVSPPPEVITTTGKILHTSYVGVICSNFTKSDPQHIESTTIYSM